MKTPEQAAQEFIGGDALAGIGYERDYEVALAAIRHDRAGRAENIPQTSASERIEAARKALVEFEESESTPYALDEGYHNAGILAIALRALITPPGVGETDEAIAADRAQRRTPPVAPLGGTDADTLDRARFRMARIFEMFYDDERGEPDQAIRDLLTDVLHEAEARGVNIHNAISRATWMYRQEQAEWANPVRKRTSE